MNIVRSLLRGHAGSASVEFALVSLFMFGIISVALDFGLYAQQRMQLANAVEQGAVLAYNQQVGSDLSSIRNYVAAAARTKGVTTVSATCNAGGACGDGKCSCIGSTGAFVAADTCNAPCPGSSAISGNYLRIDAQTTYAAMVVPDAWLNGSNMTASTVVRLQ